MEEYFLPVIVTDELGEQKILQGQIEISDSKKFSMLRLPYDKAHRFYLPLTFVGGLYPSVQNKKTRAIIITKPSVFANRLNIAVSRAKPYFCTLQFSPSATDVGFIVRKHQRLEGGLDFPPFVQVKMEDIVITTDLEKLKRGEFPDELLDSEITDQFNNVRESPRGIIAGVKSVVGDFTFVKPQKEWIERFHQCVLHPDTWQPAVIMDQVVLGGAFSPCLSFWHTNGLDHVEIRRNTIQVCMQSSIEGLTRLFSLLLAFLNSQNEQKYAHLNAEYFLDLGMIQEKYFRMQNIQQSFSFQGREKFYSSVIEKGYGRGMSIFGIESYEENWIVHIGLSSQKNIHVGKWSENFVQEFMHQADCEVAEMAKTLWKDNDKYEAFNRLRTEAVQKYI